MRRAEGIVNKMSQTNSETLRSYTANVDDYVAQTPSETVAGVKEWLDQALSYLSYQAKIIEVGAGYGRRSEYIISQGYKVVATDASDGFCTRNA